MARAFSVILYKQTGMATRQGHQPPAYRTREEPVMHDTTYATAGSIPAANVIEASL